MCAKDGNQQQISKMCEKCRYIHRPFRKDINDTVYCEKILKIVDFASSCSKWEFFGKE